jgi:hypothetical protein
VNGAGGCVARGLFLLLAGKNKRGEPGAEVGQLDSNGREKEGVSAMGSIPGGMLLDQRETRHAVSGIGLHLQPLMGNGCLAPTTSAVVVDAYELQGLFDAAQPIKRSSFMEA